MEEYEVEFSNIKAEVLMNYLYPDFGGEWIVDNMGLFYRNYQEDLISVDVASRQLLLARSSYLKLLPGGVISNEQDGGGRDAEQRGAQRRNIQQLTEIFKPIDSYRFRHQIKNESFLSQSYEQRVEYLLKHIYSYDLESQTSEYVRRMAPLLLLRERIKGDMGLIRDLLESLLEREVTMSMDSYQENDWAEVILSRVVYVVVVEGLSHDRYGITSEQLTPLFDFIREWFVPLELRVEFKIHDAQLDDRVKPNGLLGYNMRLK